MNSFNSIQKNGKQKKNLLIKIPNDTRMSNTLKTV